MKVNTIWLCLTPYYFKSEPWRIGMNETVYRNAFKTQQFYLTQKNYMAQEKVKTFKETVSFHLASNRLNFLNQMYFDIFYIFPLYQPGINIAHNARGHYGKIRPQVLTNHSARYIFTSSSHIIIYYIVKRLGPFGFWRSILFIV